MLVSPSGAACALLGLGRALSWPHFEPRNLILQGKKVICLCVSEPYAGSDVAVGIPLASATFHFLLVFSCPRCGCRERGSKPSVLLSPRFYVLTNPFRNPHDTLSPSPLPSRSQALRTTAVKDPTGKFYVVNGEKKWITNGAAPLRSDIRIFT